MIWRGIPCLWPAVLIDYATGLVTDLALFRGVKGSIGSLTMAPVFCVTGICGGLKSKHATTEQVLR